MKHPAWCEETRCGLDEPTMGVHLSQIYVNSEESLLVAAIQAEGEGPVLSISVDKDVVVIPPHVMVDFAYPVEYLIGRVLADLRRTEEP